MHHSIDVCECVYLGSAGCITVQMSSIIHHRAWWRWRFQQLLYKTIRIMFLFEQQQQSTAPPCPLMINHIDSIDRSTHLQ